MLEIFKRLTSYLWNIPIEKSKSSQNEYLELVWSKGKKILNSRNANYSYGTDSQVFEKSLAHISERTKNVQRVLILGFGCGGIVELLEKKLDFSGTIVGIEYDKHILDLYHEHFAQQYKSDITVKHQDALSYISNKNEKFGLVLVDLFTDMTTAPILYSTEFIHHLCSAVTANGSIIINTIATDSSAKTENFNLSMSLAKHFKVVEKIHIMDSNEVLICQ